jgi:hypothetical protein
MIVLMNIEGRRYIKDLSAANICKMTMPELIEFESRVWALAEKTKFPLRSIDVLNAIYREVEWRAVGKEWRDATNSR